jgi:hypothetical protein
MRRHVQLFHLAQARRGPLSRRLNSKPPNEWPEHIRRAWAILHDELGLTEADAFQLILDSVSAAQNCAQTVNRRSHIIVEATSRAKVCHALKRVANCCRRASAGLRRHLDEAILPLLAQDPIDSEVIEAIIDATAAVFELFSEEEAAATGSRAMMVTVKGREPNNWLKNNYAGLRAETQGNCEAALSKLGKKKRKSVKAHMVFDALVAGLENKPTSNPDPATLISNYVSALALLWKAAGLNPGRAYRESDPSYKSKFHRYSDLILTAVSLGRSVTAMTSTICGGGPARLGPACRLTIRLVLRCRHPSQSGSSASTFCAKACDFKNSVAKRHTI